MITPENFDAFDKMLQGNDLKEVKAIAEINQLRMKLTAHFAAVVEFGLEEQEEPEED
ncbi:MAG: hypothetical protein NVSMB46_03270 [Candidatus Saccharimonadales bacterium]